MKQQELVSLTDVVGRLTEADRQGRSVRVFSRSVAEGDTEVVGRAVGFRLGSDQHAVVVRADRADRDSVIEMRDIVRVELV